MDWILFGKRLKQLREERRIWENRARFYREAYRRDEHQIKQLMEIIACYENEVIRVTAGQIVSIHKDLPKTK